MAGIPVLDHGWDTRTGTCLGLGYVQGYVMGWALAIPTGNTPVLPVHYPGYTVPTRAVHRGAGYLAEHPLLNANAFLSILLLVDHRFTI